MPTLKLGNTGARPGPEQNACFVNSVLQLLNCVPFFREFFRNKEYEKSVAGHCQTKLPICNELSNIFKSHGAPTSAGYLRTLIGSMSNEFEYIKNGNQQDATQFLQDLLNTVESELNANINFDEAQNWKNIYEGKEIIQYNFSGNNSVNGACPTCHMPPGYAEKEFNIFVITNLYPADYSLQQMINQNLLTPSLTLQKYCSNVDNCPDANLRVFRPATSTRIISKFPNVIFIQVPKFGRRGYSIDVNKHNGFITIQDQVQFEIVGVLDHEGSSSKNGHWLTWAKLDYGWYKCNDMNIAEAVQQSTFSSNNYLFVCLLLHS